MTRTAPSQMFRTLASAVLLAALAGCGRTSGLRVLSGTVALREYLTDANGVVTDSTDHSAVTGVIVRVLMDSTVTDSVRTSSGRFSLSTNKRSVRLVIGATILTADTLGPFALERTTNELPHPVTLGDKGAIRAADDPVSGPSVRIFFTTARPDTLRIAVRAADGTIVRTLAQRAFAAGQFTFLWDRVRDDATAAPAGLYEVTLEHEWVPGASVPHTDARDLPIGPPVNLGPYHAGGRTLVRLL